MNPKRSRKEFSDEQKARIFRRDRATCVFSGRSLWALDYGVCPLVEWDWVDHLKPDARGGRPDEANGACVSYTYNMKKRSNGADRFVLLDPDTMGAPSVDYFYYFGAIPEALARQLQRLARIEPADWFFNRAVCQVVEACWKAFDKPPHDRGPEYYRNAAIRKFAEFVKRGGSAKSILKRGLVLNPKCEDVKILLSMIEPMPLKEFADKLRRLKAMYAANARAMRRFWNQQTLEGMKKCAVQSLKDPMITPAVREAIRSHLHFWKSDLRE